MAAAFVVAIGPLEECFASLGDDAVAALRDCEAPIGFAGEEVVEVLGAFLTSLVAVGATVERRSGAGERVVVVPMVEVRLVALLTGFFESSVELADL